MIIGGVHFGCGLLRRSDWKIGTRGWMIGEDVCGEEI